MEHKIVITPAWDKRDSDPNKNYGIHCAEIIMSVQGELGVVEFVLFTGWYLPENTAALDKPFPADVGYHSISPRYEGQWRSKSCRHFDGRPCYYDGSTLAAQEVFDILVKEGSDGIWKKLEECYNQYFLNANKE